MLCLVGCTHNAKPLGKPLPNLTYENLNPYLVSGGRVRIQQSFQPDLETKKYAARFPIAPDALINRYANRRFVTSPQYPEKLVFDIKQAKISKVSDEDNLVGFLSGSSYDFYKMNISIAMTPVRADGQRAAPFTIKFTKDIHVPQNASVAEREVMQFEVLEKMMLQIDSVVTDMVQNKMTPEYF